MTDSKVRPGLIGGLTGERAIELNAAEINFQKLKTTWLKKFKLDAGWKPSAAW
jgi:hypothetical protein